MTREKHDPFGKELLRSVLEPMGNVTAGKEILAEPLKIDVTFQASTELSGPALEVYGLPGRLVGTTACFEPY